jgi:cytochrome c biogenesis protein CcmG/thiol:disulfide interchange protein DsbE
MVASRTGSRIAAGLLALALLAGLAVASYLVAHHENQVYGDATLALANCPETETVNCDLVNSSRWSEIAGLPIAALALPTYLLLLGLLAASRRSPEVLAYVFCVGLLAVLYSVVLFVISKTLVGYLCLWCMRLYVVNISIPILSAFAARRSPAALVASTFRDLRRWPPPLRRAGAAFVGLLAVTIAGDQALRAHVRAVAAAERARIEREGGPTVPAVPPNPDGAPAPRERSALMGWLVPEAVAAETPAPKASGPYKLGGPLRRIEQGPDGLKSAPFDLQSRIGAGKPIALIFWAPGFEWSERALIEMDAYFRKNAPQLEVYAISGRRDDQRDEEIQESFALLGLPAGLPLLVDDGFAVSKALTVGDVPNVALFSATGQLVVGKIKDPEQLLITPKGNRPAGDVVVDVAKGVEVPQIQQMFPYYPSARFVDRCAPAFTGKLFGTGAPFAFSGRSTAGRPTLVMFWSSTCKHCQVDVPQLVKWVKAHPNAVDVIGVTIIKKDKAGQPSHRAITEAYIRAQGIPWTVVEDAEGIVTRSYDSISTPTTFFVSPSGAIEDVWYYAHEEGFDAAMDRSLAKARAATGVCRAADVPPGPQLATSVVGADGKRVELASLLDKPSLVHFWATWCKPCVEELPTLMKFRDTIERDGSARVVLVSVESEADAKRIQQFQKTIGLDLRSYRAPKGGVADHIDMSYRLPRTFVVAPGGAVLDERQGSQPWGDPAVSDPTRTQLSAAGSAKR